MGVLRNAMVGVTLVLGCSGGGTDDVADTGVEDSGMMGTDAGDDAGGGGGDGGDGGECPLLPRTIGEDMTVGPGCVRIDRTSINNEAKLTVAPGTTVRMLADGYLHASSNSDGGALVAVGTAAEPIVFTSDAVSPQAGDWQCVRIGASSSASDVQYTTFEYGGAPCAVSGADPEGMLQIDAGARAVSNNVFQHSSSHGVLILPAGGVRAFANNKFEDNAKPSINIAADQLLQLGENLTFTDADDYIDVNTTFSLRQSGTWRGQPVPFRVAGGMEIRDKEVTIGPGAVLQFNGDSLDVFNANLIVAGTAEDPVRFTSSQATPSAGDWGCVVFSSVTGVPRFDHAVFEYAGNGTGCSGAKYKTALSVPSTAIITNTTFKAIAGFAVQTSETDCGTADWCTTNTFEMVQTGPLGCGSTPAPIACRP